MQTDDIQLNTPKVIDTHENDRFQLQNNINMNEYY